MSRWFSRSRQVVERTPTRRSYDAKASLYRGSLATCCVATGLIVAVGGCSHKAPGGDRKPVFPVRGRLLVDNGPAPGAMLVLHPVNASQTERPFAKVGPDGSFEVTTYDGNDGAPAGEYVVTAEWRTSADREAPGPWPNVLQARLGDPKQTDLRVTINPAPNDLPPITITR